MITGFKKCIVEGCENHVAKCGKRPDGSPHFKTRCNRHLREYKRALNKLLGPWWKRHIKESE